MTKISDLNTTCQLLPVPTALFGQIYLMKSHMDAYLSVLVTYVIE